MIRCLRREGTLLSVKTNELCKNRKPRYIVYFNIQMISSERNVNSLSFLIFESSDFFAKFEILLTPHKTGNIIKLPLQGTHCLSCNYLPRTRDRRVLGHDAALLQYSLAALQNIIQKFLELAVVGLEQRGQIETTGLRGRGVAWRGDDAVLGVLVAVGEALVVAESRVGRIVVAAAAGTGDRRRIVLDDSSRCRYCCRCFLGGNRLECLLRDVGLARR